MPVDTVHLGNFKGFGASVSVEIRPITVFVGPNSSGKSSCIHALACLSQTVKVANNTRPLVLDHEYAMVHLGRFIEVIHSHSYSDHINLGIGFRSLEYGDFEAPSEGDKSKDSKGANKYVRRTSDVDYRYEFKCTLRTQEVSLESGHIDFAGKNISFKRGPKEKYQLTLSGSSDKFPVTRQAAFLIEPTSLLMAKKGGNLELMYPLISLQEALKTALNDTLYLGPFRQPPQRRYATRGSGPTEVGALGEATITMLANEAVQSQSRPHIKQIAKWLQQLGLASDLDVGRIGRSDLFDVSMTLEDGEEFPIADLGYGMSQVLPVLAQCAFAPKHSTLLFEQPELHLHMVAAKRLSSVFVETATTKAAHIVIETHSPELVKAFIQEVKSKRLKSDDLIIYDVRRVDGETKLSKFDFDEEMDIYENWEKGLSTN